MLAELASIVALARQCTVGHTLYSSAAYADIARADRGREVHSRPVFPTSLALPVVTSNDVVTRCEYVAGEDGIATRVRYTEETDDFESLGRRDE